LSEVTKQTSGLTGFAAVAPFVCSHGSTRQRGDA
jgi:hypothetical protein